VIGQRLLPALVVASHEVVAATRDRAKFGELGWKPRWSTWREGFRSDVSQPRSLFRLRQ
jgi:uncharacterized protein YbjT (DUF2867 family)